MSLLAAFESNPDFADGTFLSATQLNTVLRNTIVLDGASRYGRTAFCSGYGENPENDGQNPNLLWRGGFVMVAGATTLTIETAAAGVQATDRLHVQLNGAAFADRAFANGLQTHAISIAGAGFAPGQVVEVKLYAVSSRERPVGDVPYWTRNSLAIRDAYLGPIGLTTPWPGLPTFGPITEAALDQLANACTWLARRIGQRIEPLFQAIIRKEGPWNGVGETQTTVRWTGSLVRSADHPTVRAFLRVQQKAAGTTEQVRLRVNGVTVATYNVPSTPGEYSALLTYNASAVPVGTPLWIEIDHRKSAPQTGPLSMPDTSRLSIYRVWSDATPGTLSPEPELGIRSNLTFGPSGIPMTLQTWLNRLRSQLNTIYLRLEANPEIWSRQPLYRARYALEAPGEFQQFTAFEPSSVALTLNRVGSALLLRGKGLTVAYGPGAFKDEFNDVNAQAFENFRSVNAIDADEMETGRVFLDSIPDLPPFAPFNVRGVDLYYAGEELLVEEA